MALEVRRVITGHDRHGKAVVTRDETLRAVQRRGPTLTGCEIWSTDRMPADNSAEGEAAQRQGFVKRYNYVGNGQGTTIRITQLEPGGPKFMHRTETVDYAIVLAGECDLELVKRLRAAFIDPRRLRRGTDEPAREQVRQRRVPLPVHQHRDQQVGAAQ